VSTGPLITYSIDIICVLFTVPDHTGTTSADRVLQSLGTVTAWTAAAMGVYANRGYFRNVVLKLVRYDPFGPYKYDLMITKGWLKKRFSYYSVTNDELKAVIEKCGNAKVHAEAALMAWAYSRSQINGGVENQWLASPIFPYFRVSDLIPYALG